MENHPIPQDVTGFQFKLVGNMTIKQFAYVGGGIITAVILYYLPMNGLIKFPLLLLSALSGVVISFVPIEGRPLDLMAGYFFKALLFPNQYIYRKVGGKLSFTDLSLNPVTSQQASVTHTTIPSKIHPQSDEKEKRLQSFLYSTYDESKSTADQKEIQLLSTFFSPNPTSQPAQTTPAPQPATAPVQATTPEPATTPANQQQASVNQSVPTQTVQSQKPAAPNNPANLGFPNLITGIVRDSRGNVLGGILIEVKNKDGDSVRAFKTNALGQFASATQLSNGEYTITFEDPKGEHTFNALQVVASGTILPHLEITSIDAREELRKSLFG